MATENELRTLSRKKQSPIDIRDDLVRPKRLPPLTLIGHWLNDGEAILVNEENCPSIFLSGERIPSILKCGPLNDEYEFHNAHFHWGEDDCNGAEHAINGSWFSMEAHLVHWNRKYHSFDECLKYEDGLCVLAYLFLVNNKEDCDKYSPLERITDNLKDIIEYGSKTKIAANCLCWIRSVTNTQSYYFYKGSFNKGELPECVVWIVFPNLIPIRSDQLAEFRKLKNKRGEEIKCNTRKLQHLGDRKIYKAIP